MHNFRVSNFKPISKIKVNIEIYLIYSYLLNKRAGSNKQAGWKFFQSLINGQAKNVLNKRVGWKFS